MITIPDKLNDITTQILLGGSDQTCNPVETGYRSGAQESFVTKSYVPSFGVLTFR